MATGKKTFTSELTTGFGEKSNQSGGRFFRKDGNANTIRKGIKFLDQLSWYHTMISMPAWKFWTTLLATYIGINGLFGFVYLTVGIDHLNGADNGTYLHNYIEAFFFSAQTF